MLLGQIGTWITAWFAYNYHWQMVYYAMLGAILVAILITLLCMPYNPYQTKHSPLSFSKFGNVVVFCLMCCSFCYVMVYGKVYDWFDDYSICLATAICIVSTLLFVYLEKTRRSPYFMLKAFHRTGHYPYSQRQSAGASHTVSNQRNVGLDHIRLPDSQD